MPVLKLEERRDLEDQLKAGYDRLFELIRAFGYTFSEPLPDDQKRPEKGVKERCKKRKKLARRKQRK